MRRPVGVIADDFTGATDVATAFQRSGSRVLLFFGTPADDLELPPHDVLVVALKIRTVPAQLAVSQAMTALTWLRRREVRQVFYKFCSTFDSTPRGNIGPVLDSLSAAMSVDRVPLTPSSPEHARTQYQGHLFVASQLLAESPMRNHPLTPMTDSSLPRLLAAQTKHRVDLIDLATVHNGQSAIQERISTAVADGAHYLLADAIDDDDLRTLGRTVLTAPLIAGAAGLAGGLAFAAAERGIASTGGDSLQAVPPVDGPAIVLSGSCSARTLEQLGMLASLGRPSYLLDPVATPEPTKLAHDALKWYDGISTGSRKYDGAPVIYSSVSPSRLREIQDALGTEPAAAIIEKATALIAAGLVERGIRRIVTAGGETSGAVVSALAVTGGVVGPEAARGVPWIFPTDGRSIALLLKSGNFGDPDLLATASS